MTTSAGAEIPDEYGFTPSDYAHARETAAKIEENNRRMSEAGTAALAAKQAARVTTRCRECGERGAVDGNGLCYDCA